MRAIMSEPDKQSNLNRQPRQSYQSPNPTAPSESGTLLPNDHLELLVELMRPGSIELSRRWISALMMVPEPERESIVQAVEAQIVADYVK